MGRKIYFVVSAVIFAIVGIAHLGRAFYAVPIHAGPVDFPVGLSWVGGIVAVALCLWGLSLTRTP